MYEAWRRYGRSLEMVLKIGGPNFYITWDPSQLSSTVWLSLVRGTKGGFGRGGHGERHGGAWWDSLKGMGHGGIVMAESRPAPPVNRPHTALATLSQDLMSLTF